jgi:hypothetical protein
MAGERLFVLRHNAHISDVLAKPTGGVEQDYLFAQMRSSFVTAILCKPVTALKWLLQLPAGRAA